MALSTFWLPDHHQGIQSFQLGPKPYTHKATASISPALQTLFGLLHFDQRSEHDVLFGMRIQVFHVSLKFSLEISTRDLQNFQKDGDSGPELCKAHTYWSKHGKGTVTSTLSFPVKVLFFFTASSACPLREWMKPCWVTSHPTKLARAPVLLLWLSE